MQLSNSTSFVVKEIVFLKRTRDFIFISGNSTTWIPLYKSNQILIAGGLLFKFCISPFNSFFAHQNHLCPLLPFLPSLPPKHWPKDTRKWNKKRKVTKKREFLHLLLSLLSVSVQMRKIKNLAKGKFVAALWISMTDTSCDFLTLTERQVSSGGVSRSVSQRWEWDASDL